MKFLGGVIALAALGLVVTLAMLFFGCAPAKSPEAVLLTCIPSLEVEAAFIAEILQGCDGYESTAKCPAFGAIDAKYEPLRESALRKCSP